METASRNFEIHLTLFHFLLRIPDSNRFFTMSSQVIGACFQEHSASNHDLIRSIEPNRVSERQYLLFCELCQYAHNSGRAHRILPDSSLFNKYFYARPCSYELFNLHSYKTASLSVLNSFPIFFSSFLLVQKFQNFNFDSFFLLFWNQYFPYFS